MTDTHINSYAEAISAVATAEGSTTVVEDELFSFAQALQGSDELRSTLADPKLPVCASPADRRRPARGQGLRHHHLGDLAGRGQRPHRRARRIVDATLARSAESRGEAVAEVRSAVALTDDQQARLAAALGAATGREVAIRNIVDPTVLGGVVTQIGDTVIDGSVRTRLNQLRDAF